MVCVFFVALIVCALVGLLVVARFDLLTLSCLQASTDDYNKCVKAMQDAKAVWQAVRVFLCRRFARVPFSVCPVCCRVAFVRSLLLLKSRNYTIILGFLVDFSFFGEETNLPFWPSTARFTMFYFMLLSFETIVDEIRCGPRLFSHCDCFGSFARATVACRFPLRASLALIFSGSLLQGARWTLIVSCALFADSHARSWRDCPSDR